jgi:alkaline phosphatase
VFGNGSGERKDVRDDLPSVDTSGNKDYKQAVSIPLSSETHGGGDVMLLATGAGSKAFKGSLDNTKVFGLIRQAFGF